MKAWILSLIITVTAIGSWAAVNASDDILVYEGSSGIGKGKHIVWIANDHEYRSEQTCPLLAKILAKHHGFRCTVLFGVDEGGHIKAGAKRVPGMEALKDADLLVFFTRFMTLPDSQAELLVDYFERGGPVVGIRTSTHAFNGQPGKWKKLNFNYNQNDYQGGLGEQIFGNTWNRVRGQSHYGSNHVMACTISAMESAQNHPILRGVDKFHAYSGAYRSQPPANAVPLLQVQVLNTFQPSDDINTNKPLVNAGWTRATYVAPSGTTKQARVVYTSFGASEDMLDPSARRFLLNASLWALSLESKITKDLNISIVGKFRPSFYTNGVYFENVKPADLAGWESQIMPASAKLKGIADPKFIRRANQILKYRPQTRKWLSEQYPDLYGPDAKPLPPKSKD